MFWFVFSQCFRHYIWLSIGINKTNRFNRIKSIFVGFFSVVSCFCNAWLSDEVLFLRLHCVFCCQVNETTGKSMCMCTTLPFISSVLREKGGRWESTQQTCKMLNPTACQCGETLEALQKDVGISVLSILTNWQMSWLAWADLSVTIPELCYMVDNPFLGGQPLLWWLQLQSYH